MNADKMDVSLLWKGLRKKPYDESDNLSSYFSDKACFTKMNEEQFSQHIGHPSPTPSMVQRRDDRLIIRWLTMPDGDIF